ncbi:hypothetical protein CLOM_g13626 [Closterium sp. NIES-68]|nr:hypothetical protein CLOM_g13626 [Closterium sp. NIES-68]GJP87033.1 hypothetical protein CLOP_g16998 [Closterium sp. NIES-67]
MSLPSSPAHSAASSPVRGNAPRRAGSASHSPPPSSSRFQATSEATVDCVAHSERRPWPSNPPSNDITCAARQRVTGAGPEPPQPSTQPESYGLSLQQLQHLASLTAANDSSRDASSASYVFTYASDVSSRDGSRDRRGRLSLDSAQRRLDSWNRASRPVFGNAASGNSLDHMRSQRRRLKRSRSEPSLLKMGGEGSSGSGLSRRPQPLDAVVSEARRQASRHSLRRSRSAHALGEKDTNALWVDAMTALIWRRGGAVIYRRPDGPTAQESAANSADNRDRRGCDGMRQISPTAANSADSVRAGSPFYPLSNASVISRRRPSPSSQTPLPTPAESQRSDGSQQSRPWSSASASGRVAAQTTSYYDGRCRAHTAPSASAAQRVNASRAIQPSEESSRIQNSVVSMSRNYQSHSHQRQQQLRTLRDPVKSVFAWAAEQRIASRRTQAQQ